MTWSIHHISVPSSSVRRDAEFFRCVIGLTDGAWTYPDEVGDLHHDADGAADRGRSCGQVARRRTQQGRGHGEER